MAVNGARGGMGGQEDCCDRAEVEMFKVIESRCASCSISKRACTGVRLVGRDVIWICSVGGVFLT